MLELVFPTRCAVCERRGRSPCPECVDRLHYAGRLDPPAGLSSCRALLVYEGVARDLVRALKYRNQRASVVALAQAMHALVAADLDDLVPAADGITWAPTSRARRRARGFDQAEALARAISRVSGVPCRGLLHRTSAGSQTSRRLAARLEAPAFEPTRRPWASIVVVDDVLTTGATLSAAARALRSAGARQVHGLVAAHTPAPGSLNANRGDDHSR